MGIPHKRHLKNENQGVFQIFLDFQRLDHIYYNKLWRHYVSLLFPQFFTLVSPYKDPVENHHMGKIFDRIITGFFVLVFGIMWFCSTRYYVNPQTFNIVIYDVYGKESKPGGIRTKFKTREVAISYIKEYQKLFPHLDFSIQSDIPEIKRTLMIKRIMKKDHK